MAGHAELVVPVTLDFLVAMNGNVLGPQDRLIISAPGIGFEQAEAIRDVIARFGLAGRVLVIAGDITIVRPDDSEEATP